MTPEQASSFLQIIFPGLEQEVVTTRRVIAAVPEDKGDYKPHERSMSAIELVRHLAFSDLWFIDCIVRGEFSDPDDADLAALDTPSKVLAVYEDKIGKLLETLRQLPGEHLAKEVQFFTMKGPLITYLNFAIGHAIHHRGQLSVYLRPMGAKVPSIYGGSADEAMTATTQA